MRDRGFLTEKELVWCSIRVCFCRSQVQNVSRSLNSFAPEVPWKLFVKEEAPGNVEEGAISTLCDAVSLWSVWGG